LCGISLRYYVIRTGYYGANTTEADRRVTLPACIIHEDSAFRVNSAKQVALSPEKRGPPRAEGDWVRCDALLALTSNRQSVIVGLDTNSMQTPQI